MHRLPTLLLTLLTLLFAAPTAMAQVSLVRQDGTPVYNVPDGARIGQLKILNPVIITQRKGAWLKVTSPLGKPGWVRSTGIEQLQNWKYFDFVCQQWTMSGNVERMRRCLENAYGVGIHFGDPVLEREQPSYVHDDSIEWAVWNTSTGAPLADDVIDVNSPEFKNLLFIQRSFALFPRALPSAVGLKHLILFHAFSKSDFAGGWFSSRGYIYSQDMSDWDLIGMQSRNVLLHELSSFIMLQEHADVDAKFKAIMARYAKSQGSQSASMRYLEDWHDFDFDAESGCGDKETTSSGFWCGYGRAEPENDFNTMAELLWSSLYVPGYSAWERIGEKSKERGFGPIREKAKLLLDFTARIVLETTGKKIDLFDTD